MSQPAPASSLPARRPLVALALTLLLALAAAVAAAPSASAAAPAAESKSGVVSANHDTVAYTATRDGWGAEVVLDLSAADRCTVRVTLSVVSGANQTKTVRCDDASGPVRVEAGYGTAIRGVTVTLISGWRIKSSGLVTLPEPIADPSDAADIAAVYDAMDLAPTPAMIAASDGCSVPAEIDGLLPALDDLSDTFFLACVLHDYGYLKLGNERLSPTDADRAAIDADFKRNMLAICDTVPPAEQVACDAGASTFYTAVRIGGGAPFYS
ncbi:phospholipase A2 [Demequina salsinemoris]|uniref:phospholipase A2 n=1 Tax=Demequina salsinemoris TaxID=577470 RepID=UPI00078331DB|nr:phospholipase A2 [Demequina salsinemoris]